MVVTEWLPRVLLLARIRSIGHHVGIRAPIAILAIALTFVRLVGIVATRAVRSHLGKILAGGRIVDVLCCMRERTGLARLTVAHHEESTGDMGGILPGDVSRFRVEGGLVCFVLFVPPDGSRVNTGAPFEPCPFLLCV